MGRLPRKAGPCRLIKYDNLLKKEVYFVGYKVTAEGVTTDEKKVAAIRNYLLPTNTKQLKPFWG
jgi:hypothetical protein